MSKKEQLLQIAEDMVREGGYNNVSFRTLADAAGIKSASVHYHFPTKEDLGAALAERYTDNFLTKLGKPEAIVSAGKDPIESYIQMFRNALSVDKKMCLCGMLGAEFEGLPEKVRIATRAFFSKNIDWLTKAFQASSKRTREEAQNAATSLVAQLEGALLIGITLADENVFETAIKNRAS
jgi:TetR/AcrR family transcriptional repressor of nem operon